MFFIGESFLGEWLLEIELGALCFLGKHFTRELNPQLLLDESFKRQVRL